MTPRGEDRPARLGLGVRGRRRAAASTRTGWRRWPADGIGQITRLAGSTNLRPVEVAAAANAIQRYLVEETRLGIPAIIHEECLHGLHRLGGAVLPAVDRRGRDLRPGRSSTAMAATIRRRMLATGARHALAPVLDIARDPRWGRIEETYGEDPYLAAELGCAYVRGAPGPDLADGVHRDRQAHGRPRAGRGRAATRRRPTSARASCATSSSSRSRRRSAQAGIGSVMPAYCDVDGVPCHASRELLTTILRDEWGFDGIVASDYIGHRDARDGAPADRGPRRRPAALALVRRRRRRAAADRRPTARRSPAALDDGRVDEALLDAAVGRVLRMKFRLGLFERPYVDAPTDAALGGAGRRRGAGSAASSRRALARPRRERRGPAARARPAPRRGHRPDRRQRPRPARRLQPPGPHRDAARDAHGRRRARRRRRRRGHRAGRRARRPADDPRRDPRRGSAGARSSMRAGPASRRRDRRGDRGRPSRSPATPTSAIVVLGERSGLTDDSTTGEFRDRRELGLPRPPAGAARGRRRDRHAGRARRRQRPAAGDRVGGRATAPRSCSPGCPATPGRMRSPTS